MTVCVPAPSNPETVKCVPSTCWSHDKLLQLLQLMLSHPLQWSIEDDRRLSVRGSRVFRGSSSLCVIISLSARRFLMSPLPPLFPPTQPPPCVLMANSNKRLQQSSTPQKITAFEVRTSCDFRVNTEQGNYLLTPPLKIRNRARLRVTKKANSTESDWVRAGERCICNQDVCAHITRSHTLTSQSLPSSHQIILLKFREKGLLGEGRGTIHTDSE